MELVLTMIHWKVRKWTDIKVLHFILQIWNFRTHLIVQKIYYNSLSYRHKGFTGKYATRKIQTVSRVAQAPEDEQHLRCSPQFVFVLPRRFRAKERLLAVYWSGVFSKSSLLMIFITLFIFPLFHGCFRSQFVYEKKNRRCLVLTHISTASYMNVTKPQTQHANSSHQYRSGG